MIDILGVVLFRQVGSETRTLIIKRFVLKCFNFDTEHTGVELSKACMAYFVNSRLRTVYVWSVVCDNAPNNAAVMEKLGSIDLNRLKGQVRTLPPAKLSLLIVAIWSALSPLHKVRKVMEAEKAEDEASEKEEWDEKQASGDKDIDPEDDGTTT
ncbi:hypothetical protein FS749_014025 [Ceratobasidium sp. UAMH 11750]|nr:hypothetical protein FS749_014025 [Ceratobasidium sp. UAMH 11750]